MLSIGIHTPSPLTVPFMKAEFIGACLVRVRVMVRVRARLRLRLRVWYGSRFEFIGACRGPMSRPSWPLSSSATW